MTDFQSTNDQTQDAARKHHKFMEDLWPVQQEDNICPFTNRGKCYDTFLDYENECKFDYSSRYPDDIKDIVSKNPVIQIGMPFDIVSLLSFNGESKYLIRNKNGDHDHVILDCDTFRGKYVMVLCFLLPLHRLHDQASVFQKLANLCFELYETGRCSDVEIVLVPKLHPTAAHDDWVVDQFLSAFPPSCLVVPFHDTRRCDYICCYLDIGAGIYCKCFIVDPHCIALFKSFPDFAHRFGADSFPFTRHITDPWITTDSPWWKIPTQLEEILGCTTSDVLYKVNQDDWAEEDREKVSILELKQKVVGLFFWSEGTCCINRDKPKESWFIDRDRFAHDLLDAYNHCRAKQRELEIVVLYIPFSDCVPPKEYTGKLDKFMKDNNISWWKMPFDNSKCLRLNRIFGCGDNKLIVSDPRNEYVDCNGRMILTKLGPDAYPFTEEGLLLNQTKLLRDLTFESLLVSQSYDYVLKGDTQIPLADIQPFNVLLYFSNFVDDWIFFDLHGCYDAIKSNHPNFEVIYVCRCTDMDDRKEYDDTIVELRSRYPWLAVRPYEPEHSRFVKAKLFPLLPAYDTLVLFGTDGHVCSVDVQKALHLKGPQDFPFDRDLRKDVISRFRCKFPFMEDDK